MLEYIIIMLCLVGCSYTSYNLGVKNGCEGTLKELLKIKVIKVDDEGNISTGGSNN